MSVWLDNRVQQTSTTAGSGNLILDGTIAGRQLFVSAFGYNTHFWYLIEDGDIWEHGIGQILDTVSGPQLQRLIFRSSSSGTPINFSSNTKTISAVAPAEAFGPMSGMFHYATSTGTGAAYELAVPFPILTLYPGLIVAMLAHADCAANATIEVSELAAAPIRRYAGMNVQAGDIKSGQMVTLRYSGTAWIIEGFVDAITPAGGTIFGNLAITGTGSFGGNLIVPSLNGALFTTIDNPILNADFQLWQRGTALTFGAGGGYQYLADRWVCFSAGAATFARSTDAGTGFLYSIDITNGAALQNIESLIARNFVGKNVTVTVCAKRVSGSGNFDVTLSYPGAADNWASVTTIGAQTLTNALETSSFAEYKATFNNLPSNVANGLRVYLSATGQYRILWAKIEEGTGTPGFKPRHPALELALCQRYYEKSYNLGIDPGSVSYVGAAFGMTNPGGWIAYLVKFNTHKRTIPTMTFYNPETGAAGTWRDSSGNNGSVGVTYGASNFLGRGGTGIYGAGYAGNVLAFGHWIADAEI